MLLLVDQVRRAAARGNTVVLSLDTGGGELDQDADYPLTNLYDGTSETTKNDSLWLSKYWQGISDAGAGATFEFFIKIDLGEALPVRAALVSGIEQERGTNGIQIVTDWNLEYSADGSTGWTSIAEVDKGSLSASTWYPNIDMPRIALIGTQEYSYRYFRIKCTCAADTDAGSQKIRIGYIGLYGQGDDLAVLPPSLSRESMDVESTGKRGHVFRVKNGRVNVWSLALPTPDNDAARLLWQLANGDLHFDTKIKKRTLDGTISDGFFDPSKWPIFALFASDTSDSDTDEQEIKRHMFSSMVTVDPVQSHAFEFAGALQPDASLTVREWTK